VSAAAIHPFGVRCANTGAQGLIIVVVNSFLPLSAALFGLHRVA